MEQWQASNFDEKFKRIIKGHMQIMGTKQKACLAWTGKKGAIGFLCGVEK